MISYSNGKFIPTEKVAIPIANDYLGFKCGYRIFTSSTTTKHKFFRIDDHIDRLITSAKDINMDLSFSSNELSILIKETISKNNNIYLNDLLNDSSVFLYNHISNIYILSLYFI